MPGTWTDSLCQNFGTIAIAPKSLWKIPIHYVGCPSALVRWTLLRTEIFCWPFLACWTIFLTLKNFHFVDLFTNFFCNFLHLFGLFHHFLDLLVIHLCQTCTIIFGASICTKCPLKIFRQRQICTEHVDEGVYFSSRVPTLQMLVYQWHHKSDSSDIWKEISLAIAHHSCDVTNGQTLPFCIVKH